MCTRRRSARRVRRVVAIGVLFILMLKEGKTGAVDKNTSTADIEGRDTGLYEELVKYSGSDYYPCHMPGHKRNEEAGMMSAYYGIDITEIDGFDNLHHAEGILREAQQRANRLYGNEDTETFYLVNGSTCGVLASIMAVTEHGEEILIARNCHKSVYHAAIMQELRLHYYYPMILEAYGICDGAAAEDIIWLLEKYPDCRAVVITSPTYEGIISDIHAIADVVHAKDKVLIVDEAHGAHLGLNEAVPDGALSCGADLVIHSLHKTLPSMTQTALLHVQGRRVDRRKLRKYLSMLQTSSPSYVLMASMDCCIRYMETYGTERYAYMRKQYDIFLKKMEECRYIQIGGMETGAAEKKTHMVGWDIGKLVIYAQDHVLSGQQLYDLLRDDYHLQMEMAAETYVLAVMTIMDTREGWQRLADALRQIDDRIDAGMTESCISNMNTDIAAVAHAAGRMTAARAFLGAYEEVPLAQSAGRVAADFINLYPPGIPLIVPGEAVEKDLQVQIEKSVQMGLQVQGVTPEGKIMVVRQA